MSVYFVVNITSKHKSTIINHFYLNSCAYFLFFLQFQKLILNYFLMPFSPLLFICLFFSNNILIGLIFKCKVGNAKCQMGIIFFFGLSPLAGSLILPHIFNTNHLNKPQPSIKHLKKIKS